MYCTSRTHIQQLTVPWCTEQCTSARSVPGPMGMLREQIQSSATLVPTKGSGMWISSLLKTPQGGRNSVVMRGLPSETPEKPRGCTSETVKGRGRALSLRPVTCKRRGGGSEKGRKKGNKGVSSGLMP